MVCMGIRSFLNVVGQNIILLWHICVNSLVFVLDLVELVDDAMALLPRFDEVCEIQLQIGLVRYSLKCVSLHLLLLAGELSLLRLLM